MGWNQQSPPTKVLLLFKLIHIMDDHKLNHSTEVKRRMPSPCYLAQGFIRHRFHLHTSGVLFKEMLIDLEGFKFQSFFVKKKCFFI